MKYTIIGLVLGFIMFSVWTIVLILRTFLQGNDLSIMSIILTFLIATVFPIMELNRDIQKKKKSK